MYTNMEEQKEISPLIKTSAEQNPEQREQAEKKAKKSFLVFSIVGGAVLALTATVFGVGLYELTKPSSTKTYPLLSAAKEGYYDGNHKLITNDDGSASGSYNFAFQNDYYHLNKVFSVPASAIDFVVPIGYQGETDSGRIRVISTASFASDNNLFGKSSESQNLKGLYFTKLYTSIGSYSFSKMYDLETLAFASSSNGSLEVLEGAFSENPLLNDVSLPLNLTKLGDKSFATCVSLETMDLSKTNLTTIGKTTFLNDTSLKNVTLPSTLMSIGSSAFSGATSLTTLNFDGTLSKWNSLSKDGWDTGSSITKVKCIDSQIDISRA